MLHALIVDDNPNNSDALTQLLKREGMDSVSVISPRNIQEALDGMEAVDIVFLDLEFPNHSGFVLIHEMKADPRLANAVFVAYSVHTSELNQAREAGFHSFIGKPLSVTQFPDQLRRILSGEPVWEVQ